MSYEIIFPYPPKELSPNARLHWGKKAKVIKKARSDANYLTRLTLTPQICAQIAAMDAKHISVNMYFYPATNRRRDLDNAVASSKSILDGMADALGVNDHQFIIKPFLMAELLNCLKVELVL